MSEPLSRRDFFACLARPLTRTAQILRADEQRRRNLQTLKRATSTCARCHAPFIAQGDESLCPFCRDAEAKTRALVQDLFSDSTSA